jgi:hypothetical protein
MSKISDYRSQVEVLRKTLTKMYSYLKREKSDIEGVMGTEGIARPNHPEDICNNPNFIEPEDETVEWLQYIDSLMIEIASVVGMKADEKERGE